MGTITARINRLRAQAEGAARQVTLCFEKIAALQAQCSHNWRFNRQERITDTLWRVTYKCAECDHEHSEEKAPVCESCDDTLARATASDDEAEQARLDAESQEFKTPLVFRCSKCKKIHILWYESD